MKKILSALLAAIMMISMLQTVMFAAGIEFEMGDKKDTVVGNYSIHITKSEATVYFFC